MHHFTRKGVAKWNQAKGPHRAKTKHGNYNAWLDAHGDDYDYFASVDTDHVPLPNYLERMLGYFRDPDVGFVIGPQVYGNYDNFVTKAAESPAVPLPRADPARRQPLRRARCSSAPPTPCASGRSSRSAGCTTRSPRTWRPASRCTGTATRATGKKWRSVYTPDVLAVGEGPTAWTDFFTQQLRWSRGTYEDPQAVLEALARLPADRALQLHDDGHLLPDRGAQLDPGALSCALFLGLGASGV